MFSWITISRLTWVCPNTQIFTHAYLHTYSCKYLFKSKYLKNDHWFAIGTYTSYFWVSEFLTNSDRRLSYSPKLVGKTITIWTNTIITIKITFRSNPSELYFSSNKQLLGYRFAKIVICISPCMDKFSGRLKSFLWTAC